MIDVQGYDQSILTMIHSAHVTYQDVFFLAVTQLGNPYMWMVLSALFIAFAKKDKKIIGAVLLVSLIFSVIIVDDLKNIFERPRPSGVVNSIFTYATGHSFPSGHTVTAFLVATLLGSYLELKFRIAGYLIASIVGFSRIYLWVHYPTDVITGAALGILIGELAVFAVYRMGFCYDKCLLSRGSFAIMDKVQDALKKVISHRVKYPVYILISIGVLTIAVTSMTYQYVTSLAILVILFICYLLVTSYTLLKVDSRPLHLSLASIIAVGVTGSMATSLLEEPVFSLSIVAVAYAAVLCLPYSKIGKNDMEIR